MTTEGCLLWASKWNLNCKTQPHPCSFSLGWGTVGLLCDFPLLWKGTQSVHYAFLQISAITHDCYKSQIMYILIHANNGSNSWLFVQHSTSLLMMLTSFLYIYFFSCVVLMSFYNCSHTFVCSPFFCHWFGVISYRGHRPPGKILQDLLTRDWAEKTQTAQVQWDKLGRAISTCASLAPHWTSSN